MERCFTRGQLGGSSCEGRMPFLIRNFFLTAMRKYAAPLPVLAVLAILAPPDVLLQAAVFFVDDFSSDQTGTCMVDGTSFGPWTVVFAGFGCVTVETDGTNDWLHEQPKTPKGKATHAALTIGPSFSGALTYDVRLSTVRQLSSKPKPWQVAWVLWNYTDNTHFYYFIPKPNGWELGKADPAYPGAQRFLATGTSPTYRIGRWYSVHVTQNANNTITVSVDGQQIVTFTDTEEPYTAGHIGLYTEDAHVHFDDVVVSQP